jgi:hypothetical protein
MVKGIGEMKFRLWRKKRCGVRLVEIEDRFCVVWIKILSRK